LQGWQPYQHAPSRLILRGGGGDVLGDGVDVPQGPLEGAASIVRCCPGRGVDEIYRRRGTPRRMGAREQHVRPLGHRDLAAGLHGLPGLLHRRVEPRTKAIASASRT
jgi:hypothetical protein